MYVPAVLFFHCDYLDLSQTVNQARDLNYKPHEAE